MNSKKRQLIEGLIAKGKLSEAEKKLKSQIKGRALDAEQNYLCYKLEEKRKNASLAVQYISTACRLEPSNPEYAFEKGELSLSAQDYSSALKCFRFCLTQNDQNAHYWHDYGRASEFLDNFDEAERAYKKSLELDARYLAPLLSLVKLKQYLSEHEAALVLLDSVSDAVQGSDEALILKGRVEQESGKTDEAKNTYLSAFKLNPENLDSLYYLNYLSPALISDEMAEFVSKLRPTNPQQKNAQGFILAGHAKRKKDYFSEINYLKDAHAVYKQFASNNEERRKSTLDFFISLPEYKKSFDFPTDLVQSELEPVFIVGSPRSGSTLFESLLASSSTALHSLEECMVFSYAINERVTAKADTFDNTQTIQMEAPFVKLVHSSYRHKGLDNLNQRFTDKSLENIFLVDFILSIFPKAKIVYCNRNPIASLVSILQNNLTSLTWAHDMPGILQYIDATMKAAKTWQDTYPENFTAFNYEAFIANPKAIAQPLFDFCDLAWDDSILENFGQNTISKTASNVQIRQGLNTKGLDRYKNYQAFFQEYADEYPWLKA